MLKKMMTSLLILGLIFPFTSVAVLAIDVQQSTVESREIIANTSWYSKSDDVSTFTISTAADLYGLMQLLNEGNTFKDKYINLGGNIVLNDITVENWTENAQLWNTGNDDEYEPFEGTFNGNGYAIEGMYTKSGLFYGCEGTIQNLTIRNSALILTEDDEDYYDSGAFVGVLENGTIENCHLENTIVDGSQYDGDNLGGIVAKAEGSSTISKSSVDASCAIIGSETRRPVGGIVGSVSGSNVDIEECINNAPVSGESNVGGVVGFSSRGVTITNCTNNGSVTSSGANAGGILGSSSGKETVIEDCANNGDVKGTEHVGGVAGILPANCMVTGTSNNGDVTGTSDVGGILGYSNIGQQNDGTPNIITSCTVSGSVSGTSNVGGLVGNNEVVADETKSDTTIKNNVLLPTARVTGGDGSTGALVGNNTATPADVNAISGNVWPGTLGSTPIGSTSTAPSDLSTLNSSYSEDGTLTTELPGSDGTTITTLAQVLEEVLGESNVPDTLKVTYSYNTNGHGTAQPGATVTMGTQITLPAMDNDGYYTFIGWSDGTTTYQAGTIVGIMANTTFTAVWRDDTPPYTGDYNYPVTIGKTEHGTVTIAKEDQWANDGEKITVTVTPDDAYMLDELVIKDKAGKELQVKDNGDGTYTFTMPEGAVTITATFVEDPDWVEPEPEPEPSTDVTDIFNDVTPGAWYVDVVQYAYDHGLMTGTSATTFEPDTTTSRGMIVSILHRLEGSPVVTGSDFTDVNDSDWYGQAVAWAASEGIVAGFENGTFQPNATVTREQMAAILYNYAEYKGIDTSARADLSAYSDQPSAWAQDVMEWANAEGLITGTTATTLDPQGTATRAQVAAMLQRFIENVL